MTLTLRPHQQIGVDILKTEHKGQILIPTGGGKTIIGIIDAKDRFDNSPHPINIIVVAPRILLAEQLCSEYLEHITNNNVHVMHMFIVARLLTLVLPNQSRLNYSLRLQMQQVSILSSSRLIIHLSV